MVHRPGGAAAGADRAWVRHDHGLLNPSPDILQSVDGLPDTPALDKPNSHNHPEQLAKLQIKVNACSDGIFSLKIAYGLLLDGKHRSAAVEAIADLKHRADEAAAFNADALARLAACEERIDGFDGHLHLMEESSLDGGSDACATTKDAVACDADNADSVVRQVWMNEFRGLEQQLQESHQKFVDQQLAERRSEVQEVQASLEAQLARLQDSVQQAQEECQLAVSEDMLTLAMGEVTSQTQLATQRWRASRQTTLELEVNVAYKIKESVWDVALFIGTPALEGAESAFLVLSLCANVLVQGILCVMLAWFFGGPPISDSEVDAIAAWRSSTDAEIVQMVCRHDEALEVAARQEQMHADMQSYLGGWMLPRGALLCAVVVSIWALSVSHVVRDVLEFVIALYRLPRMDTLTIAHNIRQLTIEGISQRHLACAVCLALVQLLIAIWLLLYGSLWLIKTISAEDLMLNAISLHFIMDLDELLFRVIVPSRVQVIISDHLAPLQVIRRKSHVRKTASSQSVKSTVRSLLRPALTVLGVVAVITFVVSAWLRPQVQQMRKLDNAICDLM